MLEKRRGWDSRFWRLQATEHSAAGSKIAMLRSHKPDGAGQNSDAEKRRGWDSNPQAREGAAFRVRCIAVLPPLRIRPAVRSWRWIRNAHPLTRAATAPGPSIRSASTAD